MFLVWVGKVKNGFGLLHWLLFNLPFNSSEQARSGLQKFRKLSV